jgi:hypothetical protein
MEHKMDATLAEQELATLDDIVASPEKIGAIIPKPIKGYQNARAAGQEAAFNMNVNQKRGFKPGSLHQPIGSVDEAHVTSAVERLGDAPSLSELVRVRDGLNEL